jgi:hypothetical protein
MFMDLADQPGKTVALQWQAQSTWCSAALRRSQLSGWVSNRRSTRSRLAGNMPGNAAWRWWTKCPLAFSTHRVRCPPFVEDDAPGPPGHTEGGG